MPGQIPSPCPGLIPCTPIPTARPTGLTIEEAHAIGMVAAGSAFLLIVTAFILLIAAVWWFTRN